MYAKSHFPPPTAALSFVRDTLAMAVSSEATEFFKICAYFANLGSSTTWPFRSPTISLIDEIIKEAGMAL